MDRILVLRGGALGDFIVTLPTLAALRRRWPKADIEFAGNATAAALAVNRGLIDRAHSQHESRWATLYGNAPLPEAFGAWLAAFDLVLSFWPDPEGELRRRFPLRVGQQFITGTAMPTVGPAARHYLDALKPLGITGEPELFRLRSLDGTEVSDDPTAPIAVHPGSGSPRKNWPAERWLEVLAAVPGHLRVVVGEAEAEAWTSEHLQRGPLGRKLASGTLTLLERRPLEVLVTELSRCRLFLGHDSGIAHLAAACGVRSVLLFGPTDPSLWAPPAPFVEVLRNGDDLSMLSTATVAHALRRALV